MRERAAAANMIFRDSERQVKVVVSRRCAESRPGLLLPALIEVV